MKNILAFLWRQSAQIRAATSGNEEKDVPHLGLHLHDRLQQRWRLMNISLGQGRINLQPVTGLVDVRSHFKRLFKSPRKPAELIMGLGGRAIERHRHRLTSGLTQRLNSLRRQPRRHRWRQRHVQTVLRAESHQFFQVITLKRIATGEHYKRLRLAIRRQGL